MAKETDNHLALIIVTHRHMDHIIGFSRCEEIFKEMTVDAVWMPWWESEYDEHAAKFQAELTATAMDVQQHLALAAGSSHEIDEMLGMLRNATGVDHEDGDVFAAAGGSGAGKGKGGGSNAKSLALLKSGLRSKKDVMVEPQYLKKGDKPKLPPALKKTGLQVEILGPPPDDAMAFMKLKDLKKGVGQYLGAASASASGKTFDPFGEQWHATRDEYPKSAFREFGPRPGQSGPFGAEALEAAIREAQPAVLLTAVKDLDHFLNNQSLVVLLTFEGKNLLFVGDAQAGNWEYWMYGGEPAKAPSLDDIAPQGKKVLGNLHFYKVGHHGSTNSTPITAVEAMAGEFASMCSTQEDSYGNPDKGTEVPRDPLIAALAEKSATIRSDYFAVDYNGTAVPAIRTAPKKVPAAKGGRFEVGKLYVDYFL
ncbi:MAG TPA: MBL fold metallo-hydrolase [Thermoanaerobaculia bacterium]|nr:MBL fold metallo-hydrolase [Thermoanaerobaculia bacterium]